MRLGIVGSESAKFTPQTRDVALHAIKDAILRHGATTIVSGGCHLGGIDIWAEKIAEEMNLPCIVYKPEVLSWEGYKKRNLKIAEGSDLVLCITVRQYPSHYKGMKFPLCYHCKDNNPPHVKSGGCWTAWKAKAREWVFI